MARRNTRPLKIAVLVSLLLFFVATALATWLVHQVARPARRRYVVTPDKYTNLSVRGVKVTPETWTNSDGSKAQGWLLRGTKGSPAVVMVHGYGADRSWLLNLGVKLNEATNFTVLWPDLRGHGESAATSATTFGAREMQDLSAATAYLKSLKAEDESSLISDEVGIYGVELGAYASIGWAKDHQQQARAVALDSVPRDADAALYSAAISYSGWSNPVTRLFVPIGARLYYLGKYKSAATCDFAKAFGDSRVLLLAGASSGPFRESTTQLAACFPNRANVELKDDLPRTASTLLSATGEQGEAYDRIVINFFDQILRGTPAEDQKPVRQAKIK